MNIGQWSMLRSLKFSVVTIMIRNRIVCSLLTLSSLSFARPLLCTLLRLPSKKDSSREKKKPYNQKCHLFITKKRNLRRYISYEDLRVDNPVHHNSSHGSIKGDFLFNQTFKWVLSLFATLFQKHFCNTLSFSFSRSPSLSVS